MAREILFKAKRKDNGEWVEGYYLTKYDETYGKVERKRHCIYRTRSSRNWEYAEIDESTLCQYTGLTDKNGNKIWENDVVSTSVGNALVTYVTDRQYNNNFNTGFVVRFADDKSNDYYRHDLAYWIKFDYKCGVIGNRFDNPELLGGGE